MRPYLRAANLTWNGIDTSDVKEMNFTDEEVATYRIQRGDVLLSEASGSASEVGKPGVWRGQLDGDICFQNTLLRVRPESGLDSNYLYYRFLHEVISGGFAESSRGVGIHHLGSAMLAALAVDVPPVAEQRRIVVELDLQMQRIESAGRALTALSRRLATVLPRLLRSALDPIAAPSSNCENSSEHRWSMGVRCPPRQVASRSCASLRSEMAGWICGAEVGCLDRQPGSPVARAGERLPCCARQRLPEPSVGAR